MQFNRNEGRKNIARQRSVESSLRVDSQLASTKIQNQLASLSKMFDLITHHYEACYEPKRRHRKPLRSRSGSKSFRSRDALSFTSGNDEPDHKTFYSPPGIRRYSRLNSSHNIQLNNERGTKDNEETEDIWGRRERPAPASSEVGWSKYATREQGIDMIQLKSLYRANKKILKQYQETMCEVSSLAKILEEMNKKYKCGGRWWKQLEKISEGTFKEDTGISKAVKNMLSNLQLEGCFKQKDSLDFNPAIQHPHPQAEQLNSSQHNFRHQIQGRKPSIELNGGNEYQPKQNMVVEPDLTQIFDDKTHVRSNEHPNMNQYRDLDLAHLQQQLQLMAKQHRDSKLECIQRMKQNLDANSGIWDAYRNQLTAGYPLAQKYSNNIEVDLLSNGMPSLQKQLEKCIQQKQLIEKELNRTKDKMRQFVRLHEEKVNMLSHGTQELYESLGLDGIDSDSPADIFSFMESLIAENRELKFTIACKQEEIQAITKAKDQFDFKRSQGQEEPNHECESQRKLKLKLIQRQDQIAVLIKQKQQLNRQLKEKDWTDRLREAEDISNRQIQSKEASLKGNWYKAQSPRNSCQNCKDLWHCFMLLETYMEKLVMFLISEKGVSITYQFREYCHEQSQNKADRKWESYMEQWFSFSKGLFNKAAKA